MTRREAVRLNAQEAALLSLGFTVDEAEQLRRISITLHRWYEHECNGAIERNPDDGDRPYWSHAATGGKHYAYRVPDRERGAERRLKAILAARNARMNAQPITGAMDESPVDVSYYLQGDPRGAALYIIRPGDVSAGQDVHAYYSRGLCVY